MPRLFRDRCSHNETAEKRLRGMSTLVKEVCSRLTERFATREVKK